MSNNNIILWTGGWRKAAFGSNQREDWVGDIVGELTKAEEQKKTELVFDDGHIEAIKIRDPNLIW